MSAFEADTLFWSWGPAESRFGLFAEGRVVEIHLDRPGLLAGALFAGRVIGRQTGGAGAFVDLGCGDRPGFLPKAAGLGPGDAVRVRVRADAWGGKGPLLARDPEPLPPGPCPALLDRPHPLHRLLAAHPGIRRVVADRPAAFAEAQALAPGLARRDADAADLRADLDDALESALAEVLPLPGGGRLAIEETRALTAIDVDSGGGTAADANRAAVPVIAAQMRLRGLGGQVVVDFVRAGKGAAYRLAQALREAVAADPCPTHVFGVSGLGLVELTRERRGPSLAELTGRAERRPDPTSMADAALRALLAEAEARPGRRLGLAAGVAAAAALAARPDALAHAARLLGHPVAVRGCPDLAPDLTRVEEVTPA